MCLCFSNILLIVLLQFSQFFTFCLPHPAPPASHKQSPHLCSCPWVMHISSLATPFLILYFTSPWLFCNYLFILLNPLTSSPIPLHSLLIWQPSNCSPYRDFVSVVLVCLVCFLDSIVDSYVFIAIIFFILLIFFFLSKSHLTFHTIMVWR